MKPTAKVVEGLTKETLKFELGGLIDNVIENVHILLEEDKEFNSKNLSTEEGDLIIQIIIDTVKKEIVHVDALI